MASAKKPTPVQKRAAKLAELKTLIRTRLARFWPKRAEQLRQIATAPPPPGTQYVRFEIFDACSTLSVSAYAVGAEDDADINFPFGDLFADITFPRYDAIPWAAYRRAIGRKAEPVIEEVLIQELGRLWVEAGGTSYPLPVVIGWHDAMHQRFDLATGKKVKGAW